MVDVAMPDNSLLVHIGPRKTGTTAIQQALASRRKGLRAHGVVYPGAVRQHFQEVNGFLGRKQLWEEDHRRKVDEKPWRQLLDEIGDARVGVISTEVLSQARREQVERLAASAAGRTVSVVITYRPFEDLLTSTWQQLVKEGLREPLDAWSRCAVVDRPEESDAPFPRILDLSTLIDVWGSVLGIQNVTVVLVSRSQPHAIFDAFGEMLGLPEGFLAPKADEPGKRSFTAQEAELLRLANTFLPRGSAALKRQRDFRRAVARWLDHHAAGPGESRLTLPPDVVEQARARGAQMVSDLQSRAPAVRLFGDPDDLLKTSPIPNAGEGPPASVSTALAAEWLALGIGAGAERAAVQDGSTGRTGARQPRGGARGITGQTN
jgi:hypothetical protein